MCFHLDHRRLDPRGFMDRLQLVQTDVRKSDGSAPATIHQTFHRFPGFEEAHFAVIEDVSVFIPRILFISGLKCKWSVNEVEVQILKPESLQDGFEGWSHTFWTVIVIPDLRGDEEALAPDLSFSQRTLQRFSYRFFVSISFRAIKLTKANFQRRSSSAQSIAGIGDQRSKPQGRNRPPVVHREFSITKLVRLTHCSPNIQPNRPGPASTSQQKGPASTIRPWYW